MAWVMVSAPVADFDSWKAIFDANAGFREEYGSKGGMVFRGAEDPQRVTVLLEYEDAERLSEWLQSPRLKDNMAEAGVTGPPEITLLEQAGTPAA